MKSSICCGVVLVALAACTDQPRDPPQARATPTSESTASASCAAYPPPFEASYLPDGFGARLRPGAGLFKGTDYPTHGLLGHYIGARETIHINFQTDPGPLPYDMHKAAPIPTLGSNGRISSIEGGFAVAFTFKGCDYRMDTYGIARSETLEVARSLIGRKPGSDRCPAILPFELTYLPVGFRHRALVRT